MRFAVVCGVIFLALPAFAEIMTFPAPRMGDVYFDHTFHRGQMKGCSVCHGETPGKINKEWTQQTGHDFCVDCHNRLDRGPLRCAGCHKKKAKEPVPVPTPVPTPVPVMKNASTAQKK